jgi:hypothetical protein
MWEMFVFEKKGKITRRAARQRERILYTRREKCFWPKGKKRKGNRWWKRKMLPQSWNLHANEDYLLVPWPSLGRYGKVERHPKKNLHFQKNFGIAKLGPLQRP